jgi:hypothetical protein
MPRLLHRGGRPQQILPVSWSRLNFRSVCRSLPMLRWHSVRVGGMLVLSVGVVPVGYRRRIVHWVHSLRVCSGMHRGVSGRVALTITTNCRRIGGAVFGVMHGRVCIVMRMLSRALGLCNGSMILCAVPCQGLRGTYRFCMLLLLLLLQRVRARALLPVLCSHMWLHLYVLGVW